MDAPSDKKDGGPNGDRGSQFGRRGKGLYGSQTINTGTAPFVQKRGLPP